jgi:hypothetical protein
MPVSDKITTDRGKQKLFEKKVSKFTSSLAQITVRTDMESITGLCSKDWN